MLETDSNTSIPLAKYSNSGGQDWYCCPGDPDCSCNTGRNAIKLGESQPSTVTVIGSTSWPGYVSSSKGNSASTSVSGRRTISVPSASTSAADEVSSSIRISAAETQSGPLAAASSSASSYPSPSTSAASTGSSSGKSNRGLAGRARGLGWALQQF